MKPIAPSGARASRMHWIVALGLALAGSSACGRDAERARLAVLEQEVKELGTQLAALEKLDARLGALEKAVATKLAAPEPMPAKPPDHPFKLTCPAPFLRVDPAGAALWTCRASAPTAEGLLPQCNVVFQPQVSIEVKDYFEFTLNNTPQLFSAMNYQRKDVKIRNEQGWEATFEAQLAPVPLKAVGVLMPRAEATYAVTCFAPKRSFAEHEPTFRKVIESFEFKAP